MLGDYQKGASALSAYHFEASKFSAWPFASPAEFYNWIKANETTGVRLGKDFITNLGSMIRTASSSLTNNEIQNLYIDLGKKSNGGFPYRGRAFMDTLVDGVTNPSYTTIMRWTTESAAQAAQEVGGRLEGKFTNALYLYAGVAALAYFGIRAVGSNRRARS
jgi:hypothetical protein